jgi:hypothetical protein
MGGWNQGHVRLSITSSPAAWPALITRSRRPFFNSILSSLYTLFNSTFYLADLFTHMEKANLETMCGGSSKERYRLMDRANAETINVRRIFKERYRLLDKANTDTIDVWRIFKREIQTHGQSKHGDNRCMADG